MTEPCGLKQTQDSGFLVSCSRRRLAAKSYARGSRVSIRDVLWPLLRIRPAPDGPCFGAFDVKSEE